MITVNTATDLESFANHAGRSRITTDDVLLLARRNEGLESILKQTVQEVKKRNQEKAKQKSAERSGT